MGLRFSFLHKSLYKFMYLNAKLVHNWYMKKLEKQIAKRV